MVHAHHSCSGETGRLAARLIPVGTRAFRRQTFACLLLIFAVLCLASCNSEDASRHTLVINGAVHVYSDPNPPAVYPGPNFLEVLGPQDHVKVQQVVYRNGYMAVKVKLKDGREGWVFSGESIEVK